MIFNTSKFIVKLNKSNNLIKLFSSCNRKPIITIIINSRNYKKIHNKTIDWNRDDFLKPKMYKDPLHLMQSVINEHIEKNKVNIYAICV